MRLELDTNVLISAFISRGLCSQLLEHCAETHELVTSEPIVAEIREKHLKKFRMPPPAVDEAVAALFVGMEVVDPVSLAHPISRDPDDDIVIATAVTGGCDAVITGDADLLVLAIHDSVPFLTPRDFWDFDHPPEVSTSCTS